MTPHKQLAALTDPFPIVRCRLTCEVTRPIVWPEFEGSALRGIFGQSLRKVACITGMEHCNGCPMASRCNYAAIFEPVLPEKISRRSDQFPPPYVLTLAPGTCRELRKGDRYSFDFTLLDPFPERLSVAILAWRKALSEHIGPARGSAALLDVSLVCSNGQLISLLDQSGPRDAKPSLLAQGYFRFEGLNDVPGAMTVQWQTPVQLKRAGKLLGQFELNGADFLLALARRISEVSTIYHRKDIAVDFPRVRAATRGIVTNPKGLTWTPLFRWSNRQRRKTPLSGVSGTMTLAGDLVPFWQMLRLGEVLHVGGKTGFGLGSYRLRYRMA
jgi:hypothetical protein